MQSTDTLAYALSTSSNGSSVELVLQQPGCYMLDTFSLVENVTELSIVGLYGKDETVISCAAEVGLSFVDVRGLEIQNVTIRGCGLNGIDMNNTVNAVRETTDLFHHVPLSIQYALVIANSEDVELTDVSIEETAGIGLLGINIAGKSNFSRLNIVRNRATICYFTEISQLTEDASIGGGMYLLYHDYHNDLGADTTITISDSFFHNNSYCSSFNVFSLHFVQSPTATQLGYTIGSAGGLGVTMAQLRYNVNVTITGTSFINNTGWNGAGVNFNLFQNVMNSHVKFSECLFKTNGFAEYRQRPFDLYSIASSFSYYKNLFFPPDKRSTLGDSISNTSSTLLVTKSNFTGNVAYYCPGASVRSLTGGVGEEISNITFSEVIFERNRGTTGSALCSLVNEATAAAANIRIIFQGVIVRENVIESPTSGSTNLALSSGQIVLQSSELLLLGSNMFMDNDGVATLTLNSNVHLYGDTVFRNNSGIFGGALRLLSESYLVIHSNSRTQFISNTAKVNGGAIFFSFGQNAAFFSPFNCFLYFEYIDLLCNYSMTDCPPIHKLDFQMSFINNSASLGGTIYGTSLTSCPWYNSLLNATAGKEEKNPKGVELLARLKTKFTFDPAPNSTTVVSTGIVSVDIKSNHTEDSQPLVQAAPGEQVFLDLSAKDGYEQLISAVVASATEDSSIVRSVIGTRNVWLINPDNYSFGTPFTAYGPEGTTANARIYSTSTFLEFPLKLSIQSCRFGFTYSASNMSCKCIQELRQQQVKCNVEMLELEVPAGKWAGPLTGSNNTPTVANCYYDYCRSGQARFRADDIDYQCNIGYNRTGLACGSCQPNTSAVLGTSRCRPHCTNLGLLWIPAIAVGGIILVIVISFLGLTITDGYINGFIFYCNCLNYFSIYLSGTSGLDGIWTPVAFVNLNLGIESCFFNGMSTLVRIVLRLVFPMYLFILIGLITLLAQHFTIFVRLKFSGSQTFATLLLLCYITITGTCIELLGINTFTSIYGNSTYYGWSLEPAVQYGQGWHGLTVFIAVALLLVYVLPFPLLLLFPQLLFRLSFIHKYKPLLDAFWGPLKPDRRFWLGLRALLRVIPFCLASYLQYPDNVFALIIFVSIVLFVQERLAPFEGYVRNGFDSFFLVNLILIGASNIFFDIFRDNELDFSTSYRTMIYILLLSAYIAFLSASVIQFFHRYSSLKDKLNVLYQRIRHPHKTKKEKHLAEKKRVEFHSTKELEMSEPEVVLVSRVTDRNTINFTELREPLLED